MAPNLRAQIVDNLEPGILLVYSIYWFFLTVLETIFIERSPSKLFKINDLRNKAFSRGWLSLAPPPEATPPIPNEPHRPWQTLNTHLLPSLSGTILDIGPGSGSFTPYYTTSQVKTIYGAEPVPHFHDSLELSAKKAGLEGKYRVLECGAERETLLPALVKAGLLKEKSGNGKTAEGAVIEGVFDAIVCIRVLCSVPSFEITIATLYSLLKPGGKFVICEHVVNQWQTPKGSFIGRAFQVLYEALGWTFFIGDCRLNRDTGKLLREVGERDGGWERVELEGKLEYSVLPFIVGVFVKGKGGKGEV